LLPKYTWSPGKCRSSSRLLNPVVGASHITSAASIIHRSAISDTAANPTAYSSTNTQADTATHTTAHAAANYPTDPTADTAAHTAANTATQSATYTTAISTLHPATLATANSAADLSTNRCTYRDLHGSEANRGDNYTRTGWCGHSSSLAHVMWVLLDLLELIH